MSSIPNALTISRYVAALVFALVSDECHVAVLLFAAATEFLDGFLARVLDASSDFGKLHDPIADKTFILAVLLTYMWQGKLVQQEFLMVAYRDLTVIGGALVVLAGKNLGQFRRMDPGWWGKITTSVQFSFLISVAYLGEVSTPWLYATFFCSFLSAAWYVRFFFTRGLHLAEEEKVSSLVAECRRNEMLVLVVMTMAFGLLLIFC